MGGRTLHFTITQTVDESTTYTVTYTDGVEDEEVFADDVHENLSSGVATPAFSAEHRQEQAMSSKAGIRKSPQQ